MPLIKKAVSVFAILLVCIFIDSCSGSKKTIVILPSPPVIEDRDNDGVKDAADKCPDVAGMASLQGCPDRDGDGIADAEDKCPDVAGMARYQGCPVADTDRDGVSDEVDKCPDVAGVARYQGCPIADSDGDGINDEEDKCPVEKGPAYNYGCPVTTNNIQTSTGGDSIKKTTQPNRVPVHNNQHPATQGSDAGAEAAPETKPAGSLPDASIVYSFRKIMRKGEEQNIRMVVQLGRSIELLRQDLLDRLNEDELQAKLSGSTDTSQIKKIKVAGYKYFSVTPDYEADFFSVRLLTDMDQQLDSSKPANWVWAVKALKATESKTIKLIVTGYNDKKYPHKVDLGELPITVIVKKKPFPVAWLIAGILFILLLAGLFIWLKKRNKARNRQIFFSYKWDHLPLKAVVDEMYISLKKAGFNVIKDKDDLRYRGSISRFMAELSRSKLVIIAVSEKYLKSVNCMKELFHIYSNAGMNREEFQKRIFPVTTEQLNLSNIEVVKAYEQHWQQEEQKWETYTREHNDSVTKEEAEEYEFTRRVVNEITNILSYLYDLNTMSIAELRENDFEKIKQAIREALDETA